MSNYWEPVTGQYFKMLHVSPTTLDYNNRK